jgi:hypothetical protein
MRSYLRKLTIVVALAAPLAVLAADTSATKSPANDSNPCGMPCCGPTGQRAQGSQTPAADKLSALGGQNGIANSFDSP